LPDMLKAMKNIIIYISCVASALLLAACTPEEVHYDRITLNPATLLMTVGQTQTLDVQFLSGTVEDVEWYSAAENVVKVSGGVVTAISHGSSVITARTVKTGLLANCDVLVRTEEETVSGISISQPEMSLYLGEYKQLVATVHPSTAVNTEVTWSSSDNTVATVGTDGYVLSRAEGTAVITATTAEGGFSASCTVTVLPAYVYVESVSIQQELELSVGESVTLTPVILPEDATVQDVTWASYDESIVKVSGDGVVTGVSAGKMYIEVTTVDGNKKAKCYVSVR